MSMKAMSRGTRGLQPALSAQRRQWTELSDNELAERLRLETQPPKVEYDTLAPTCVPTKHYQKSLLRLPIPKLEDTCRNYIKTVTPLLTAAELKQTEEVVKAFTAGEGPRLHDKLVAKDKLNKHTSYITDDWFDMYLSARAPLPLNFAPFLVFRQDPLAQRNTQAHRAAAFIHASLRFRQAWEENKLAPEVFHLNPSLTKKPWYERLASLAPSFMSAYVMMAGKGFPLDMSQFPRLFNSTRIPRAGKDELRSGDASRDHHIVVMYKGHPYKINVMEPVADVRRAASRATEFRPVSVEQIAARIRSVVMDTNEEQAEFPLGALTSDNRDRWASIREEMELSPRNKEALHSIDTAVFVLCLDDDEVDFSSRDAITKMGRLFLHGDPKKSNRWWDKSFQLIVSKNGYVCCNFEHSWGDGVAVMRWANDVWHTAAEDFAPPQIVAPTEKPVRIELELSETVKEGVRKAVRRFQTDVDALKYDVSVYPELGKKGLKRLKVSPDAFMQQGFQLAYKKLYGETRSTYESASTSAFRCVLTLLCACSPSPHPFHDPQEKLGCATI